MKLKFSNFKITVWTNMRPTFLPIAGGVLSYFQINLVENTEKDHGGIHVI